MKSQALWMRLREEPWADYEVSRGEASRLEKVLQDLASRKQARSMKACHEVWKLLCSGGVRSAAIITVPHLVDILEVSTKEVQMEIADILRDCATGVHHIEEEWAGELKHSLLCNYSEIKTRLKRAKGDLEIAYAGCADAFEALK